MSALEGSCRSRQGFRTTDKSHAGRSDRHSDLSDEWQVSGSGLPRLNDRDVGALPSDRFSAGLWAVSRLEDSKARPVKAAPSRLSTNPQIRATI